MPDEERAGSLRQVPMKAGWDSASTWDFTDVYRDITGFYRDVVGFYWEIVRSYGDTWHFVGLQ